MGGVRLCTVNAGLRARSHNRHCLEDFREPHSQHLVNHCTCTTAHIRGTLCGKGRKRGLGKGRGPSIMVLFITGITRDADRETRFGVGVSGRKQKEVQRERNEKEGYKNKHWTAGLKRIEEEGDAGKDEINTGGPARAVSSEPAWAHVDPAIDGSELYDYMITISCRIMSIV